MYSDKAGGKVNRALSFSLVCCFCNVHAVDGINWGIGLGNDNYYHTYVGETFSKVKHLGRINKDLELLDQYNPGDVEEIFLEGNRWGNRFYG